MSIQSLLAQECMGVLFKVASPHVVIGEVGSHEVVGFRGRPTDASGFLHGRQIEPFVIVLVGLVIIPSEESRAFHIARVKEEHDGFSD